MPSSRCTDSRSSPHRAIASGAPFLNTGYEIRNYKRQQAAAAWPLIQQMCAMDDCRETLGIVLPEMKRQVDATGFAMIYAMVIMAS